MKVKKDSLVEGKMGKRMPIFLLGSLLLGTIATSLLVHNTSLKAERQRFIKISDAAVLTIQNRLFYYMTSLRQTASMFMASENVTAKEFETYAANMELREDYPGASAIGYASFKSGTRLESRVRYFQPFIKNLNPLKNYDLMKDPTIQMAILESGSSGEPHAAYIDNLFENIQSKPSEGVIVFYPVYKGVDIPQTDSEKLNSLEGFVFGVFKFKQLFDVIIKRNQFFQQVISINVFMRGSSGLKKVYDSSTLYGPKSHDSAFKRTGEFTFGGKEWYIQIGTLPLLEASYTPILPLTIFALGSILSFLIYLIARRLNKAKLEVEKGAKKTRRIAWENSMLAKSGELLGKSLSTQKSLEQLGDFLAANFSDFCVIEFAEEGKNEKVVRASSTLKPDKNLSRLKLIALAGNFVETESCKKKVLERESFIIEEDIPDDNFKSFISLPLSMRGKLYGVVSLLCMGEKNNFRDNAEFLVHMTNISSIFIENTLLYEEAQLANRLKDEFLATVSHELRTPLNVIYGHSQLLLESDLQPEYKEQIQSIYKSAQAQSTIIEDLLDVSAIISGKVNFNPRPVKVINAIDTALESVKLEAKNRGIELIFNEASQCIIMGVKTRLVQIFWNLLSNAIKFTPEGGKVAVKTMVEDQNCVIRVIDTGKGIDPEFLPHIFEKFRQEDKVSTRNRGGLGLGLSIVAHLVNLHGGTIKAESEGKNKGAIFTISFPIVSLTTRTGPKEEKEKLEEIERHDLHDVRVLAVDDEPESLNLIARILRSYKANVITAENGQDALRKLKSERPDVLISDIAMPEMDGYELIKEIRQKERGQGTHIPAIALTAFAQEEDKERALSSGYEAYLSKPVNKDKLIGTVEQALH